MIDIEPDVFTVVSEAIRAAFDGIYVTGERVPSPPSFPCVSLVEEDNASLARTADSGSNENHAALLYEVNVYSNKQTGKKRECRSVAKAIDAELLGLGFERIMLRPVDNIADATIYRMIGRYRAVASKENVIYMN